jgi:hypothetical protein
MAPMWTKKGYHVEKKIMYVDNKRYYVDKRGCFLCRCDNSIFSLKSISYVSNDFFAGQLLLISFSIPGDGSA